MWLEKPRSLPLNQETMFMISGSFQDTSGSEFSGSEVLVFDTPDERNLHRGKPPLIMNIGSWLTGRLLGSSNRV